MIPVNSIHVCVKSVVLRTKHTAVSTNQFFPQQMRSLRLDPKLALNFQIEVKVQVQISCKGVEIGGKWVSVKASSKIANLHVVLRSVGAPGIYFYEVSSYNVRIIRCIVNLYVFSRVSPVI